MTENEKSTEDYISIFKNPGYQFNDSYGLTFLSLSSYKLFFESFLNLKKAKLFDVHTLHTIMEVNLHYYKNWIKIKRLDLMQPRIIAQKFIGKTKIRTFIFSRDGFACLKCNEKINLTIDHINPIACGGENKLSNLQTLCKSCNSFKRNTFKDYRYGAR